MSKLNRAAFDENTEEIINQLTQVQIVKDYRAGDFVQALQRASGDIPESLMIYEMEDLDEICKELGASYSAFVHAIDSGSFASSDPYFIFDYGEIEPTSLSDDDVMERINDNIEEIARLTVDHIDDVYNYLSSEAMEIVSALDE
jgi:hypothetical protein